MDGRPSWTDCDEAGDYVVPNVLSPRDLVFRPDNMDETVPHTGRDSLVLSVRAYVCPCSYLSVLSSVRPFFSTPCLLHMKSHKVRLGSRDNVGVLFCFSQDF